MGHNGSKDIFRKVGHKLDSLHVHCTWNDDLKALVKALFSEDEAAVFIKLPYVFSDFSRIQMIIKLPENQFNILVNTQARFSTISGLKANML
jgi:hypothetical protein